MPRVRLNLETLSIKEGLITKNVAPHLKKPSGPTVRVDEICEEEILRPGIYVSEVGSCKLVSDKNVRLCGKPGSLIPNGQKGNFSSTFMMQTEKKDAFYHDKNFPQNFIKLHFPQT